MVERPAGRRDPPAAAGEKRGGREYLRLAQAVKEITDPAGVPLIIDDRVDVALACGAAGVHVGQTDLPCGRPGS